MLLPLISFPIYVYVSIILLPTYSFIHTFMSSFPVSFSVRSSNLDMTKDNTKKPVTRQTDYMYPPSIWDHDFVQSLKSDYTELKYGKRAEALKERFRQMFVDRRKVRNGSPSTDLLKLINITQRLGIGYHFYDEIKAGLRFIKDEHNDWEEEDLFVQAVRFRLLREHGYEASQDVFKKFMEEAKSSRDVIMKTCIGNNKEIEGILSVYEASFYAFQGEPFLKEVKEFTASLLREYLTLKEENINTKMIKHALELPLHWRLQRLEARWFIDIYEMMEDMNPLLLEFAKLDFNMVQAIYQEDLKYISRWWKELDYLDILKFSRDRWAESFLWTVGLNFDPRKYGSYRRYLTKITIILTTIDDMNEIYASQDEAKMFSDAVERWDINTIEDLPYFMKICFMALFNSINEIAYDIVKKHGSNPLSFFRTSLTVFCKLYLEEVKWIEYTPTLEEYLNTAWLSAGGNTLSIVAFFALVREPTKEALERIMDINLLDIKRYTHEIGRLMNDLGTSSDELARGNTPTSIQCVMHETGASESAARQHIMRLINDKWEMINSDKLCQSVYPELFIDFVQSSTRGYHCYYLHGDGYGVAAKDLLKGHLISLYFEPIPIAYKEDAPSI
ncbi:hypothetical protein MKW98_005687 [Papaver atlanticum]|uniref:Uncharacterized protein n=1 Tax=Papaver atlanticum TaxID=357466 RepID=A0AAD4STP7_9MAGN|nr:hypothetical protein MKW98_005687 [Papaver atlanticum]